MAPELSSNWKKLQARLKNESNSGRSERVIDKQRRKPIIARKQAPAIETRLSAQRRNMISESNGVARKDTQRASLAATSSKSTLIDEDERLSKDLAKAHKNDGVAIKDEENGGLLSDVELGKYIAIDCEMVGVGGTEDRSVLARVSIVNFHGQQIYDSFVRPKEVVTDWRTHVSGVSSRNMMTARSFETVQEQVAAILSSRVLVGHALKHDLEVLMLGHPREDIRDSSRFRGFRIYSAGRTPSLKKLSKELLGLEIQDGQHSSIEDARAAMLLFRTHKDAIEVDHSSRFMRHNAPKETNVRSKNGKKKKKKKRGKS